MRRTAPDIILTAPPIGCCAAQEFRHAASTVIIEHDGQVTEFEAGVVCFKNDGSSSCFSAANPSDLFGGIFSAATVAGGHGGYGDPAAQSFQLQQSSGTLEFNIIRVSVNRQNMRLGGKRCHGRGIPATVHGRKTSYGGQV